MRANQYFNLKFGNNSTILFLATAMTLLCFRHLILLVLTIALKNWATTAHYRDPYRGLQGRTAFPIVAR